jgi:hypothetical protein
MLKLGKILRGVPNKIEKKNQPKQFLDVKKEQ